MTQRPPKKPILEELLKEGWVYIHLDPRKLGVEIPSHLKKEMRVVFQIGYDMPVPIPDLLLNKGGIHATLSFSRNPFACKIPWRAVFALVSNEGRALLWPHDIPQEILALQDETAGYVHPESGALGDAGTDVGEASQAPQVLDGGACSTVSRKGRRFRVFDGAASSHGSPTIQDPTKAQSVQERGAGDVPAKEGQTRKLGEEPTHDGPGAGESSEPQRPFLRLVE